MDAYVPLMQTLVWVLLIVGVLVVFRTQLAALAPILRTRIERGGAFSVGLGSLSLQFGDLPTFPPQAASEQGTETPSADGAAAGRLPDPDEPGAPAAWGQYRMDRKGETRNIHLAHVISPSRTPGQRFDIFTYLVEGPSGRLDDVERAQFFLGRYWGNRIFDVPNRGDGKHIGFATSAYGPALCICRVIFKDGSEAVVERFLDFETAAAFETSA
ncbi:pYEATS domain-containing protein [Streptomyces sp. 2A115]|uniref:pYEATS domain-containing protein n=1 Tax=Streptomyces sp. 2A115 TaxID=3457439 RepID=UPI003FD1E84C